MGHSRPFWHVYSMSGLEVISELLVRPVTGELGLTALASSRAAAGINGSPSPTGKFDGLLG